MKAVILILALLALSIARDFPVPSRPNQPSTRPGHYPTNPDRPSTRPGHYPSNPDRPHVRPGHYPSTNPDQPKIRPGHYPSPSEESNSIGDHRPRPRFLDVYQGFSTKLGLTQRQQAGLFSCAEDIKKAVTPLLAGGKTAVQAKLLSFLFADDAKHREVITTLIEKAQTALPNCRQFVQTFASVFAKTTVSENEKHVSSKDLPLHRLRSYAPEIISTLVRLSEEARYGQGKKVGEGLAFIVQLITGLSHPQTIFEYSVEAIFLRNPKEHVEISVMEPERFLQQTINNAAKELGAKKLITELQAKELINSFNGLRVIFENNRVKMANATNLLEREVATLGAFRDAAIAGGVIAEQIRDIFRTLAPEVNGYALRVFAPVMIRNYYARLPTIQRRTVDLQVGIQHLHPVESGKALAGVIRAITEFERL